MSDRPPAAGPADTSGGYGSPRPPWVPGPVPPAAPVQAPAPAAPGDPAAQPAAGPYGAGPGEPGGYATAPGGAAAHPAAGPYTAGPGEPGRYGNAPGGAGAHPAGGPYAAGPGEAGGTWPATGGPDPAGPGGYPTGPGGYPAGPGPYPPVPGAPRPRVWPPTRPEWTVALAVVGALAVLGALLAPLWERLAPRLPFQVDQPGRALPVVPAAEEYVAADGWFVLVTLAAGVVAGLGCWLLRSSRGPLVLFALAAGGLLGALVTWRLGLRLGPGYRPEDLQVVGRTVYQPLTLRAEAALVVEPIAALVVYLLAVGFSARNDLGRGDEPPVSSGSG